MDWDRVFYEVELSFYVLYRSISDFSAYAGAGRVQVVHRHSLVSQ
jgi:hypothetical protein